MSYPLSYEELLFALLFLPILLSTRVSLSLSLCLVLPRGGGGLRTVCALQTSFIRGGGST